MEQPRPDHLNQGAAADVTMTSSVSEQGETTTVDVTTQHINGDVSTHDSRPSEKIEVVDNDTIRLDCDVAGSDGISDVNGVKGKHGGQREISMTQTDSEHGESELSASKAALSDSNANGKTSSARNKAEEKEKEEKEEEKEEGKGGGGGLGCCRRKDPVPSVGIFGLFRMAGPVEVLMMVVGTVASMVSGCVQPVGFLITRQVINTFIDDTLASNGTNGTDTKLDTIEEDILPLVHIFLVLGGVALLSSYVGVSLWTWAGQRQMTRIRKLFFGSVMRQDMAWFDTNPVAQINSRFSDDMLKVGEGMGDKVPVFLQWVTTSVASYIVAFVMGWKLALLVLAFSPLFIAVSGLVSWAMRNMTVREMTAYAKAGAIAEQALRAIRTVQAFDGQQKEHSKYEQNLSAGGEAGMKKGLVLGVASGVFELIVFVSFAASYYYGVVLIQTDDIEPGNVFVVFVGVFYGSLALGYAFPNLETFSSARAAAVHLYDIINRQPPIDVSSSSGVTLTSLNGFIEFKDVHFQYPARPDVPVLRGLSLRVSPGQTLALVGSSGCGKSTALQLLQRFYDPLSGQVLIDGHDIRGLQVGWLREQMGVVSQEPVLFAASIADNIRFGRPGASLDLIQAAAREANAHDFISQLPLGYDTMVGERGAQLSGGQKQRVAIARALLKNPRMLLLDEATSALDSESEAVVQSALDKARQGRTTIVIAHRLSTIRHADVIVTLSEGRKVEEGSHETLASRNGMYASLLKAQHITEHEDVENDSDIDSESKTNDVTTTKVNGIVTSEKMTEAGDKDKEQEEETQPTTETKSPPVLRRLLRINKPEWPLLASGIVFGGLFGLKEPCFSFVFSEFLGVFAVQDPDEQMRQAVLLSSLVAGAGVALALWKIICDYCFAKAGVVLTARLRSMTFRSMLNQDMGFFDQPDNQVGSLTTCLAYDAALVQGATGNKLGSISQAVFTVVGSLVIAFVIGWKLALVVLAFLPVLMVTGRLQGKVIAGQATSGKSQIKEAGKICSEAVDNIRTVTSLNRADIFIQKMESFLDNHSLVGVKVAHVLGLTYGLSTSITCFAMAAAFAYGTRLVSLGEMTFYNVFRVFIAIVMGGSAVGRQSSLGVDFSKGRVAAIRLFSFLDRTPAIDSQQAGVTLKDFTGDVRVEGVDFSYPGRAGVTVLAGLTAGATPGQTVAVVGPSGCGKSTLLQLLLRFYDPTEGKVMVGETDVRTLDLQWWRHQLGLVSQEPTLFDDTIAANIAYGDTSRDVPMSDVISAARAANVHDFVSSLPQGYDTVVGDKGTQLSGGQRQRVAIARALVRQPKVLLLDEATSALDTQSERVVQEALDRARQGRTCFVIAHRLSTIQNADVIIVIQDGRVQEKGKHSELLASKGAYYGFLQTQNAFGKT